MTIHGRSYQFMRARGNSCLCGGKTLVVSREYGKIICPCSLDIEKDERFSVSVPKSSFEYDTKHLSDKEIEHLDRNIRISRDFVKNAWYKKDEEFFGKWLYIYGNPGSGKTKLARAIHHSLIHISHMESTISMSQSIFKRTKDGSLPDYMNYLSSIPILIIDDFGYSSISEYERNKIEAIVHSRDATNRLPTIFTSNKSPKQLQMSRISEATIDRIMSSGTKLLPFMISSYRTKNNGDLFG